MPKRAPVAPSAPPADPHVTFSEAAAQLGVSRHSVFKLTAEGVLRLEYSAGKPRVTRASLEAYRARQGRTRRVTASTPAA